MKIRDGFVSNSSSANFIIHWRMRTMGEEVNLKQALSNLFEAYVYDDETGDWKWDKDYFVDEYKAIFEEIVKKTEQNKDGSFTSTFWTSMMNSYRDFGEAAIALVMILNMRKDMAEIIDIKMEEEGG